MLVSLEISDIRAWDSRIDLTVYKLSVTFIRNTSAISTKNYLPKNDGNGRDVTIDVYQRVLDYNVRSEKKVIPCLNVLCEMKSYFYNRKDIIIIIMNDNLYR